ncbi:MAG: hypothetical protein VKJ24_05275 [Synechococcales bacterium]|nr:hypothetical protein [Synechococcales bacterium]
MTLIISMEPIDRTLTDGETEGFVKSVTLNSKIGIKRLSQVSC